MNNCSDWLTVERRNAPLILSFPHIGTEIPEPFEHGLVSHGLARQDTDWWIDRLYDFGRELEATFIRTAISRTVIDVNRDPSGASLYPGQTTTALCPVTTFDGEPLYREGQEPTAASINRRRELFFEPYHHALREEILRLRQLHPGVVLFDCHSIRSIIPRLFEGTLPIFNIGTNGGLSCSPALETAVDGACESAIFSRVVNGRFKGGWITRFLGAPDHGIHAVQMELACRSYMREPPETVSESNWPTEWDPTYAAPIREVLRSVLQACLAFAKSGST